MNTVFLILILIVGVLVFIQNCLNRLYIKKTIRRNNKNLFDKYKTIRVFMEEIIDYIDDYKIVIKHKNQNNKPYNIIAKGAQAEEWNKVLNEKFLNNKDDFDPIDKEEIENVRR